MRDVEHSLLVVLLFAMLLTACAFNAAMRTPDSGSQLTRAPAAEDSPLPAPSKTRTLTPVDKLGLTGTPVEVDITTYRLVVEGFVERPLYLTYDELLAYLAVSQVLTLECPGFFVDYAEWTGPLVRTILEEAGVKAGAQEVVFSAGDDGAYQKRLTLDEALADDTLLAYKVNGVTLPREHGYPVRLAVGSKLGSYWVKWLFRIEVR